MRNTLTILALAAAVGLAGCGDDEPAAEAGATTTTTTIPGDDSSRSDDGTTPEGAVDDAEAGVVAVHIEEVDGFFVEGFEVGLRFETLDGGVIASTLWSEFVESLGSPQLEDYYDSVLEQDVPAGRVVVLASANLGIGPAPEVPDLEGELNCRLEVEVPADGRVDVEVSFAEPAVCLRLR